MTTAIQSVLSEKLITNHVQPEYKLREPGLGAIKFTRRYINEEMTYDECLEVMASVIDGYVEGIDDKKVKRCGYCGHLYIDPTKNNSSKVCSDECKGGKDYEGKKEKRKITKVTTGKARKYANDLYYHSDIEYPFWVGNGKMSAEDTMMAFDRKRGVISLGDNFENVVATYQRRQRMGGKRKNTDNTNLYESKWSNSVWKPSAEFWGDTKPVASKVKVIKRTREDIEAYMLETFGEKKLAMARKRALDYAKGRY